MILIDSNNVLQAIAEACARIGRPKSKSKPAVYKKHFDGYIIGWELITDTEKQKILDILLQIINFYKLPQIREFFRKRPRSKIKFFTSYHYHNKKFHQHFLSVQKDGLYWVYEKNNGIYLHLPLDASDLIVLLRSETEMVKRMLVDLQIMTTWEKDKFEQQVINSVFKNRRTHTVI